MSKVETIDPALVQVLTIPFGQVVKHNKKNMETVESVKKVEITKITDEKEIEGYVIKYFRAMNLNKFSLYGIICPHYYYPLDS